MDAERHRPRARSVQRKVSLAVYVSVFALGGCKDSAWTPMGSADLVLSEIKLGGSAKVARRIDADENFGRSVANGIATGDSAWLEVAREIAPASSAAEATLAIALAMALPRSPVKVLQLVGQKYPVEEVCGIPFLKADSAEVTTYHNDAVTALDRVRDSSLSATTTKCRSALDDAQQRRLERINPAYIIKNKPTVPARSTRRRAR
jgi:hypothetical protein